MTDIPEEQFTVTLVKDPSYNYGGQHVGTPNNIIRVEHKETFCAVEFRYSSHTSQHRNRQMALMFCRMAAEESLR